MRVVAVIQTRLPRRLLLRAVLIEVGGDPVDAASGLGGQDEVVGVLLPPPDLDDPRQDTS